MDSVIVGSPADFPADSRDFTDFLADVSAVVLVVTSFLHREHGAVTGNVPVVQMHVVTFPVDEISSIRTLVSLESGH